MRVRLEERWLDANRLVLLAIVTFVLIAVFFPMAAVRLVDGDEGYYIMTAKLVNQGRLPFIGFFYQQMFLLPFVYAPWLKVFGSTWYSARYLSASLAVLLGLLLYFHSIRITGRRTLGLLAVALFAFSGHAIGWLTVVKTFTVSTLLLFGAYAMFYTAVAERWKYLLSGLFLGLAVDTRLFLIAVLPAFAIQILGSGEPSRRRLEQTLWFALGLALALLPNLYFLFRSPRVFMFDNIIYQSRRTPAGLIGNLTQKWDLALQLLGLKGNDGSASIQLDLSLLLSIGFCALTAVRRQRLPLSVWIALLLTVVCFLPTPVHLQYFVYLVPFLVVNVVLLFARLDEDVPVSSVGRRRLRTAMTIGCALYVLVWPYDYYRYGSWSHNIPGLVAPIWDANWKIPVINRVGAAVDRYTDSTSHTAISWWPGYFIQTKTAPFPRMENHFGIEGEFHPDSFLTTKCHFISDSEVDSAIQVHATRVAVLGNWSWFPVTQPNRSPHRATLLQNDYVKVAQIGDAEVYRWEEGHHEGVLASLSAMVRDRPLRGYRSLIWPGKSHLPAGLDSAGIGARGPPMVTDFAELADELVQNRRRFDDYLPALAGWVVNDGSRHLHVFDYMNDLENFVAVDYRFTLLAVARDSSSALYDIRPAHSGVPGGTVRPDRAP